MDILQVDIQNGGGHPHSLQHIQYCKRGVRCVAERDCPILWHYFDEFHVLLRDQLTASYFVAVWKMLRKKGCVPSALTQNVKDLLASAEISNILDNTDFMVLLSQAQSDRAILAKQLGISEHQLSYITHSNSGEGLLFYGNVTIPFIDRFPRGEIYDLLTTRPEDMAHERKDE